MNGLVGTLRWQQTLLLEHHLCPGSDLRGHKEAQRSVLLSPVASVFHCVTHFDSFQCLQLVLCTISLLQ